MVRKIIIIALIISSVLGLYWILSEKKNMSIKIAIYPSGSDEEAYYFEINDNKLYCALGTRFGNDMQIEPFLEKVDEEQEKNLRAEEIQRVIGIANELGGDDLRNPDIVRTDSWEVMVYFENRVYRNYYGSSKHLDELVNEMMRISPIELKLRSFA